MPYCPECSASVLQGAERCPTCGAGLVDTPKTEEMEGHLPDIDITALQKSLAVALGLRYEILKLLGVGGMGAVFLAREVALKRLVAVKVLAPSLAADASSYTRFQREARASAALSHPNIVRVYAVGQTRNKLPYMIQQYIEGTPLTEWLRQRGRVPERDARRIFGEIAGALAAAHSRDLIHRDIKPANVLIEHETGRSFVVDFGVSAAVSPAGQDETKLTRTGMMVGTPPYMSPEQAAGDGVTAKSDVYSLGVLAYELLTGVLPFSASTVAGWAAAHLRDTPDSIIKKRSETSPQLARLIDRCLSKRPAERPAAAEVARALLPSLEKEIRWPPPGLEKLLHRGHVLARDLIITAAAGLLVLLTLVFTPDVLQVGGDWVSRFAIDPLAGSVVRARPTTDTGEIAFFVWQTALVLGSAVFLVGVFHLGVVVYWLRRSLRYRALGWGWLTLFDVAADPDGGSGALLAGGGEYGFLDAGERHGVLQARRRRVLWLLAASLWLFVILGVWIGGAFLGLIVPDRAIPLAGPIRLGAALIPSFAFLIVADLALRAERRLLGPASARRAGLVTPVEVEEWYRIVPDASAGQVDPRTYPQGRRVHLWAVGGVALIALVISVGLGEIVLASVAAARFVQSSAPRAAELIASTRLLEAADPYGEVRRVLRPYLPRQTLQVDGETGRLARRLFVPDTLQSIPPLPLDPEADGAPSREAALDESVRRAYGRKLAPETVAMLEAVVNDPRTEAFSVLAQTPSVDYLHPLMNGTAAPNSSVETILPPSLSPVMEAAHLNTLAAISDLQRGEVDAAATRLGEGAAVALRLLETPVLASYAYAMLASEALSPLAALADAEGRPDEARTLRAARDVLVSLRPASSHLGAAGLAAEAPEFSRLSGVVLRSPLPLGERFSLLMNGWAGLCGNPREIISGPSRTRDDRLLAMADSTGSLHARELMLLARRPWATTLTPQGENAGFFAGLMNRSPAAITRRMLRCAVGIHAAQ